jgi:F0F1-type ATP synthase delta subunit
VPNTRPKFVLPLAVVGPADVNRLQLELEALEDYLRQQAQTEHVPKLPKMSRMLESLGEHNEADLLLQADRNRLEAFLKALEQHAPTIHISFASEPSAVFTQKVLTWLRGNISSYILLQIGLQPTIAAGCVVRTTNKVFDMSLRQYLTDSRHLLVDALQNLKVEEEAASRLRREAEIARIDQAASAKVTAPAPAAPAAAPVQQNPTTPTAEPVLQAVPEGAKV